MLHDLFHCFASRTTHPPLVIKHPSPPLAPEAVKSTLRLPRVASSSYIHLHTPHSPLILASLPPEILDAILVYLDSRDVRALRRTHRLFRASVQAAMYAELHFYDFRPSSRCKKSKMDAFFRMLDGQPDLARCVKTVSVSSVVDPLRLEDIKMLLPRVLGVLGEVRSVVLGLGDVRWVNDKLLKNVVGIVGEVLLNSHVEDVRIEARWLHPTVLDGLRTLPVSSVMLARSEDGEYINWRGLEALAQLKTVRCLQLRGGMALTEEEIYFVCNSLPHLNDLSILTTHSVSPEAVVAALEPVRCRLRELGLRRVMGEGRSVGTGGVDLRYFTALRKLDIDSTLLASPSHETFSSQGLWRLAHCAFPRGFVACLETAPKISENLPAQLTRLKILFNKPAFFLSRSTLGSPLDPTKEDYEELVEYMSGAFCNGCCVELVEGEEGLEGEVKEYKFSHELDTMLRRRGLQVGVWVHLGGGMVVRQNDMEES
ncbi:hypothetical protein CC86DRAFT_452279 [Ophiobolus disseminans]|uniref:F-box domain-containing protein n=1 Tax=Ophiobolus disseminans TaxID=1469910 RepID=A0A6A7ACZ2_9PLEO|nr:hypothetical protein CC86DRAFT_452279 [Ophiobolus disseminans]